MSWRSHGHDNASLVEHLHQNGVIKSDEVKQAMLAVDRGAFVAPEERGAAYQDTPQPIGYGATISAPHMHAACLEYLKDKLVPGAKVLDVGCGSGYLTTVFAWMVAREGAGGVAVGVEHIGQLVDKSRAAVNSIDWAQRLLQKGDLKLLEGDGYQGHKEDAPYDAIHVGAAAPQVPQSLLEQLKPHGRLIIPVGEQGGMQVLASVEKKDGGEFDVQELSAVAYVPLTDKKKQLEGDQMRQDMIRRLFGGGAGGGGGR